MHNAIILTDSQVFERYPDNTTNESILAREAIKQGYGIALIECKFFSRFSNIPFLTDVSIEAIKNKISDNKEVSIRFFIDTSLLKKNQLIVAFKK